jgi:hypothetical protein
MDVSPRYVSAYEYEFEYEYEYESTSWHKLCLIRIIHELLEIFMEEIAKVERVRNRTKSSL